ncbi:MAG: hypothetical protein J3K34DRAFT_208928 [Monoraphidium minutum]|nr:MAG: hypothetical protein J3K34DRAFT_208928 [Monoraphidium minutum]
MPCGWGARRHELPSPPVTHDPVPPVRLMTPRPPFGRGRKASVLQPKGGAETQGAPPSRPSGTRGWAAQPRLSPGTRARRGACANSGAAAASARVRRMQLQRQIVHCCVTPSASQQRSIRARRCSVEEGGEAGAARAGVAGGRRPAHEAGLIQRGQRAALAARKVPVCGTADASDHQDTHRSASARQQFEKLWTESTSPVAHAELCHSCGSTTIYM